MAINRVDIKDFLVFKGEFTAEFCPGVNVLIGGNGTGKTTLLEVLNRKTSNELLYVLQDEKGNKIGETLNYFRGSLDSDVQYIASPEITNNNINIGVDFEKAIKKTVFISANILGRLRDIIEKIINREPTSKYTTITHMMEEKLGIKGIVREKAYGAILTYVVRPNDEKYILAFEASGIQKFVLLYLLLKFSFFENGSILFWDEPENSLNPELITVLVDILLELSRNGVQIFIATHSEILASYLAVNRQNGDKVMFTSLYKDGEHIKANTSDRFDLLEPNNLTAEPVKLYEKEIERGMGSNG